MTRHPSELGLLEDLRRYARQTERSALSRLVERAIAGDAGALRRVLGAIDQISAAEDVVPDVDGSTSAEIEHADEAPRVAVCLRRGGKSGEAPALSETDVRALLDDFFDGAPRIVDSIQLTDRSGALVPHGRWCVYEARLPFLREHFFRDLLLRVKKYLRDGGDGILQLRAVASDGEVLAARDLSARLVSPSLS